MQQREFSIDGARTTVLVLSTGDDPVTSLTDLARTAGLDSAYFTAIGAFERATVGRFDLELRDYRRIPVDEQVEVISLMGDITLKTPSGREPLVHAHVVLGRLDGRALGGHLLSATVRPTLEVVLTETTGVLRRRHDDAAGLALIDLDAAASGSVRDDETR
jgi:predicted DNA-binding protein with PD1-like motif